jgi:hypothetical protein
MEFWELIDRLDDILTNGKQARRGGGVRVDKAEVSGIVDKLRGAIPEEVTQARWIAEKREEMLAEAEREAARVLEEAREERARLLGRDEVAKAAEHRAGVLLDEARALDREIRQGAEDYASGILEHLETYLGNFRAAVVRGRERLTGREAVAAEPAAANDRTPVAA